MIAGTVNANGCSMSRLMRLFLKSLSLDVSFTPGFSPVMNHTKRRRTVLTVCSSPVRPLNHKRVTSNRNGETVETVSLLCATPTPG
jgi:hypothetical protein